MDVLELDAASNNSVDNIRELLEQVRYPAQMGKYKVYIIDEVHMLSTAAFNALLKTLEEPPAHVVFILLLCYFVVFPVLGRNYDAAVMCAGLCGHGLGAVPSAMVNMTVLADQYGMSRKAFLIVPVVGSCLADLAYQPHTLLLIKLFVEKMN